LGVEYKDPARGRVATVVVGSGVAGRQAGLGHWRQDIWYEVGMRDVGWGWEEVERVVGEVGGMSGGYVGSVVGVGMTVGSGHRDAVGS